MRHSNRDIRDEFEFHRQMAARAGYIAGEVGPTDAWMEECRDIRRTRWLEDLGRDLRFALRRLRHAPAFAAVAILTLALGIGANTAIFTVVNAVMLRRLPVPHPEQLVLLGARDFDGMESGTADHNVDGLTFPQYLDQQSQNHAFSGLAGFSAFEPTIAVAWGQESATAVPLKFVSANYFRVLDLAPARGRFFDSPTAATAVVSYGFWQAHPGCLGATLRIRDAALTVIGVAPRGFTGTTVGQDPAVYIPIAQQPRVFPGSDWLHDPPGITRRMWLLAVGRLRPGVTVAQARGESGRIFAESVRRQAAQASDAATRRNLLTQYVPVAAAATGVSSVREQFGRPLLVLMALVGLVLLVVTVNLGGMLLEQAAGRQREFALRLAIGAGRRRLIRQLLTETLLLAGLGGALGLWLAQAGVQLLVGLVAGGYPGLALPTGVDPAVLGFTAGVCVLVGIAFGLAPALQLSRCDLSHSASRRAPRSAGPALVVAQVALSIVLVTGAALFVRSLGQLRKVPLGYRADHLASFNVNAAFAGATAPQALNDYERMAEATARLPGVRAVTYSHNGLFTGSDSGDAISVAGRRDDNAAVRMDYVAPGYFAALGIPLRLGREFTAADRGSAVPPAIMDQPTAQRYFPGRSPVGREFVAHFSYGDQTFEVVGVSAKAVQGDLRSDATRPRIYFDIENGDFVGIPSANFLVRTGEGAALTRPELNAMVARVSGMPIKINSLTTIPALLDSTLAPDLLMVKLAGFFGVLALGLAAMGLYAMLSYGLARRRSEIAVRMALGARAAQVLGDVLRRALFLLACGTGLGVAASLALDRSLASLLYGVVPADPLSLAAAAGLLLAAGLAASLVPALRAAHTDPARTLRAE